MQEQFKHYMSVYVPAYFVLKGCEVLREYKNILSSYHQMSTCPLSKLYASIFFLEINSISEVLQ